MKDFNLLNLSRFFYQDRNIMINCTIGELIRELRLQHGYTLTQLGGIIGIDSGALSKIETGKKSLDDKFIPSIAKIFNLDFEKLKEEFLSEKIARAIIFSQGMESSLELVPGKIKMLKSKLSEQSIIEF